MKQYVLELIMANVCMDTKDLQEATGMPRPTLNCVIAGRNVRPATIGKVAKALRVNVEDILEEDEER